MDAHLDPAQTPNARGFFTGQSMASSPISRTRRPSLKVEDGAEFFGAVESIEGGRLFRASCHARRDHNDQVETEMREFRICPNAADAEKWIAQKAAQRGFPTYKLL
jgi:hypothetical protein